MATKKTAPKKAAAKPAAKKPAAKPVAKKEATKPAPKKAAAKPVAKKAAAKPAPKKAVAKPAPKKAVVKPAPKKVAAKPAPKKVEPKKAVAKPAPKKEAVKPIVPKVEPKKVEKIKPVKEEKIKEVKPTKKVMTENEEPVAKVRKPRAKKAKRIVRVPKPPKPVKATGIEKATTVIPVKKVEPKPKDEPVKNFKVPKITAKSSVTYSPGYVPMDRRKEDDMPQTPMVRYSDAELNEFKDLITKKLEAAKKELAYLQGVITHKGEMGDSADGHHMSVEDGSMTMEREQMSNFASRQITFIDHLEKALQRIENKTYGICRVTGKLIDKARLRAVPHATLSLEAKLGLVKPGE